VKALTDPDRFVAPGQFERQRGPQNQHAPPHAANLGMVRPPSIYMAAIVTGLLLHFAWPIPFVPCLAMPFGALIAVFAATLFIWSIRTFDSAGTPVDQGCAPRFLELGDPERRNLYGIGSPMTGAACPKATSTNT
jgi:hypothetical protein